MKRSRFRAFEEMRIDKFIAIADRFEPERRRWVVAYEVAHARADLPPFKSLKALVSLRR